MTYCKNVRAAIRQAAILVAAGASALTASAAAQDQPVVFAHGMRGTGAQWSGIAADLQNRFQLLPFTPTLNWTRVYAEQAGNMHASLSGYAGTAAISHSNGGIVTRSYLHQFGSSGRVNRHLAIGSLHQGAPLAANALNGNVTGWGAYVFYSIADPINFYRNNDPEWRDFFLIWVVEQAAYGLASFFGLMGYAVGALGYIPPGISPLPVLPQMVPGSTTFQALNSGAGLQSEAARASARVSIATETHPFRVPFGLLVRNPRKADEVRFFLMRFAEDAYYHYSWHPDYFLRAYAWLWANMYFALYDINAVWQFQIGALVRYDGQFMEYIRNDGILAWTTSDYPNGTRLISMFRATDGDIDHLRQLGNFRVRGRIDEVVEFNFQIARRPPPPPPPPPDDGGGGGGGWGGCEDPTQIQCEEPMSPPASGVDSARRRTKQPAIAETLRRRPAGKRK